MLPKTFFFFHGPLEGEARLGDEWRTHEKMERNIWKTLTLALAWPADAPSELLISSLSSFPFTPI
jgi:hypothetical protein